jgi:hypothetical protein
MRSRSAAVRARQPEQLDRAGVGSAPLEDLDGGRLAGWVGPSSPKHSPWAIVGQPSTATTSPRSPLEAAPR